MIDSGSASLGSWAGRRLGACVGYLSAVLVALCSADVASAYFISSVEVSPAPPITTSDPVSLEISLWTSTISAYLYAPTEVDVIGNEISVNVFAYTTCEAAGAVGCVAIVDFLYEDVYLGLLAAGDYNFTVTTHTPESSFFDSLSGSFTVVPEPGTAILVSLGLLVLGYRRRPGR